MAHRYKLKEFEVGDIDVSNGVKSKVTNIDPDTGSVSWSIDYIPNIDKLVEDVDELTKTAKGVYQKAKDDKKFLDIYEQARSLRNTIRTHVRNNYPDDYKKAMNEGRVDEQQTTHSTYDEVIKSVIDFVDSKGYKLPNSELEKITKNPPRGPIYGWTRAYTLPLDDKTNLKFYASGVGKVFSVSQNIQLNDKLALDEEDVEEMSMSGGAGGYLTPYAFRKKGAKANDKAYTELGYTVVKEDESQYPSFEVDRNIKYQDGVITQGYWTYTGKESGGKGVYLNVMNQQMLGFDREDLEIFNKNLSSHFNIIDESAEQPGEDLGPGPKATEDGVKDNAYVKQFKYKLVPKNNGTFVQKGSGLEVNKLF
jgi:hypothetical protein